MTSGVWHCWATPENADVFEVLFRGEICTGIRNRQISGYRGIQLFRRSLDSEMEFETVMWFASMEAVRLFAGEDHEVAVVPPKTRELLSRFDERTRHYEVKGDMEA